MDEHDPIICPDCGGTGMHPWKPCPCKKCNGTGELADDTYDDRYKKRIYRASHNNSFEFI